VPVRRVYTARWVVPVSSPPVAHGAVAVDDAGRIVYVGPAAGAPEGPVEPLGDAVLVPGLVDAHTHLELTAFRGLLEHADFFAWIRALTRARAEALTEADLHDAAHAGVCEGLAAGVTTFADTAATGAAPLEALIALGARGVVYRRCSARPRRSAGPPSPPSSARSPRSAPERRGRRRRPRPCRREPHAVYSVHEDLLLDACAWAVGEGSRSRCT
jgi:5-methylthioadenosine/S-adenosylhomocysteine deaminase